jgi:hypothetical protein
MNTLSIDFKQFVACDNSPFILFSAEGKILYLNNAAEILMGYVDRKELFDIVLSHAPKEYGYKTTSIPLQYDAMLFYAITVGYQDDEHICIRLYHQPRLNRPRTLTSDSYVMTDINTLLEANITLFQMTNHNDLSLLVDQDIPPFKIDQNHFSKLLRKTLHAFRVSEEIHMTLKFLIGEYIIINEKKESLIQLTIEANSRYPDQDSDIEKLANAHHITSAFKEHSITLQIPFIQQ